MSSHQRSQYDNASQNNTTRIGQAASRPNYVNVSAFSIYKLSDQLMVNVTELFIDLFFF